MDTGADAAGSADVADTGAGGGGAARTLLPNAPAAPAASASRPARRQRWTLIAFDSTVAPSACRRRGRSKVPATPQEGDSHATPHFHACRTRPAGPGVDPLPGPGPGAGEDAAHPRGGRQEPAVLPAAHRGRAP